MFFWPSTLLRHLFHALNAIWYCFCASVLPCRAPWGRPFLITWCGIERASSLNLWNFCWIRFQPRSVRRCSRSLLDSNREDIENTALLKLFRVNRITLPCPFHESSLSNCYWMGCRRYFAASLLEVLLDEDDFRSSSRARERGSFQLVSQLHVVIQTLWNQRLFPRAVWTNRLVVHSQASPFLIIGFLILVSFVGSLHYLQQLLNPSLSSNYL